MDTIIKIASNLGLEEKDYQICGKGKLKIEIDAIKGKNRGKLILVTSINPTPYGEGKTTTAIGLTDAFNRRGRRAIVTLREPSLGPVFGVKGGATGGGKAMVVPSDSINLLFTGDIPAIERAHNLLSAVIDNHLYHGNGLKIDVNRIYWNRAMDMNDRALRDVVIGLGESNGVTRETHFEITAASEIMAILALAQNYRDLKNRIDKIYVADDMDGNPIFSESFNVSDAMVVLLKEALKPNLVRTLENSPALIHAGPFANIAHGTNSILATRFALQRAEFVITEAGFGSDLGGEKFFNIVSRQINMKPPDAVLLILTIRAIKWHGGIKKKDAFEKDLEAVEKGFANVRKHIENLKYFNVPFVLGINRYEQDDEEEVRLVKKLAQEEGVDAIVSTVWDKGGEGALELSEYLETISKEKREIQYVYEFEDPIKTKIEKIVKTIYGGKGVHFSRKAKRKIRKIEESHWNKLPVCMAKTQYSLSDDPKLKGRPEDFMVDITDIKVSSGAGFVVAYAGDIMTMPGLPKVPAAENIKFKEGE